MDKDVLKASERFGKLKNLIDNRHLTRGDLRFSNRAYPCYYSRNLAIPETIINCL